MSVSDNLLCLFNAKVQDGSFTIEIPQQEVSLGDIEQGEVYRVAILSSGGGAKPEPKAKPTPERKQGRSLSEPPVNEGDTREVEVEDIGEQGDGIARLGPGYIVFIPDTKVGERVTVEITEVRENFAFGEVIEGPY